jgi:hypothetical protein
MTIKLAIVPFDLHKKLSPFFGLGIGTVRIDLPSDSNDRVNALLLYPFAGFVLARNRPLTFGVEAGYMSAIAKYKIAKFKYTSSYPYGEYIREVTMRWEHAVVGGFLQLYF